MDLTLTRGGLNPNSYLPCVKCGACFIYGESVSFLLKPSPACLLNFGPLTNTFLTLCVRVCVCMRACACIHVHVCMYVFACVFVSNSVLIKQLLLFMKPC